MPQQAHTTHPDTVAKHPPSPADSHRRDTDVLPRGHPSRVRSIADAVVIKDVGVFFLCQRDGDVPLEGEHGLGLYYHDCRFLNGYELRLAGASFNPLAATTERGFMATLELTNDDVRTPDGTLLPKQELGVEWQRVIDAGKLSLHDVISFHNYGLQTLTFPVSLTFAAHFDDIFIVRGMPPRELGKLHPPRWQDNTLTFLYDGKDGLHRSLSVHFTTPPDRKEDNSAHLTLTLGPQESKEVLVTLVLAESPREDEVRPGAIRWPDLEQVKKEVRRGEKGWVDRQTAVRSSSQLLDRVMERCLRDLHVLRSEVRGEKFFAAGVPWYVTLFGRDSILSSLQTLAYEPAIAEHTLRLLAGYQGTEENEWKDEQPGKVPHELRRGELARLNEVPFTPYYGTVDATPLFLVLLGRHAAWTGKLDLFRDLRDNVERALTWVAKYGDSDGDGYVQYASKSKKGLANQGWKDSGDAIVNSDGSLAKPPIALVEVQGYVYLAKTGLADLYERAGDAEKPRQLRKEAEELRERFNRDFWVKEKDCFALALQDGGKPAAVISSNPGQALWTGIVEADKARPTMEALMAEDMFSGWGVRTLSSKERRYNPVGYHLGTVWPHDNSLIAAGFRRYGFDEAARRIFAGVVGAASYFRGYRLPEVFAGFRKEDYGIPVHYPVACHPQAWAAGSVPFLVETLLGLTPEGFDKRLRIVRPDLPDFVSHLELHGLRVADARVDLRFERTPGDGGIAVRVLKVEGQLEVVVDLAVPERG